MPKKATQASKQPRVETRSQKASGAQDLTSTDKEMASTSPKPSLHEDNGDLAGARSIESIASTDAHASTVNAGEVPQTDAHKEDGPTHLAVSDWLSTSPHQSSPSAGQQFPLSTGVRNEVLENPMLAASPAAAKESASSRTSKDITSSTEEGRLAGAQPPQHETLRDGGEADLLQASFSGVAKNLEKQPVHLLPAPSGSTQAVKTPRSVVSHDDLSKDTIRSHAEAAKTRQNFSKEFSGQSSSTNEDRAANNAATDKANAKRSDHALRSLSSSPSQLGSTNHPASTGYRSSSASPFSLSTKDDPPPDSRSEQDLPRSPNSAGHATMPHSRSAPPASSNTFGTFKQAGPTPTPMPHVSGRQPTSGEDPVATSHSVLLPFGFYDEDSTLHPPCGLYDDFFEQTKYCVAQYAELRCLQAPFEEEDPNFDWTPLNTLTYSIIQALRECFGTIPSTPSISQPKNIFSPMSGSRLN